MEGSKFSRYSQAEDGIWWRLCPVSGDGLEFLTTADQQGRGGVFGMGASQESFVAAEGRDE